MKGFKYMQNEKIFDCSPCFFCKYRGKGTYASPCYSCIDTESLVLYRSNAETEYANYEPRSQAHLQVLMLEQEEGNENKS